MRYRPRPMPSVDRSIVLEFLARRTDGGATLGDLQRSLSLAPHQRKSLKRVLRDLTNQGVVMRSAQGKFTVAARGGGGGGGGGGGDAVRGGARRGEHPSARAGRGGTGARTPVPAPLDRRTNGPRGHRGHTLKGGATGGGWTRAGSFGKERPVPTVVGTSGAGVRGGRRGAAPVRAVAGVVTGRFTRHPDGFGFVAPLDKQGTDVFIPPDAIGSALHGDVVDARVTQTEASGRRAGRIVGVRERNRAGIPGRFERRGKQGFVIPDDRRVAGELFISRREENGAREGDLVLAEIVSPPSRDFFAKGRVTRILGDREDPGIDSDLVIGEFGIAVDFSPGALAEAAAFPDAIPADERRRRRDLTHVPFVTIDGIHAKDFDDAVAVESLADGRTRLYVAIADVAFFVRPGTALDEDGFSRATSVYLPDRVVPMLPERLSNDLCSLRPDEERLALCAAMDIDEKGDVREYGIDRIVFRSRARMTYEDVHGIVVDRKPHLVDRYRALVPQFERMRRLAETLRRRRFENGSIDFDLPEPEIVIDLTGATTDIVKAPRYVSHHIVEEFMLAANVTVAKHFSKLEIPLVYRVHDAPDPMKLETFNEILRPYGVTLTEKDLATPKGVGRVLARFEDRPEARLINHLMLRAMRQAQYSVDNIGHFGLAFDDYCHFTSPIRRYPDLLVHRAVHALLEGKQATSRYIAYAEELLDDAASHSSRRERQAMEAERASVALKKVRFMRERTGEIFAGHVTGVAKYGLFVELDEIFVEGLVRTDALGRDDVYEYDEDRHRIVGRRSGRSFKLGDAVTVEVTGTSLERRQIDFRIARKGA